MRRRAGSSNTGNAAVYHSGELEVQQRAGVRSKSERIGKTIAAVMPAAAQEFLRQQPFAVLSSVDKDDRVWVSVLTGKPGFMQSVDDRTVRIAATPASEDTLTENLRLHDAVGMLVIEPETRRRMRINGKAELTADGIVVHAGQVYANCPKYIQARVWECTESGDTTSSEVLPGDALSATQQKWISVADTFFIGSHHQEGGADASHRGGNPGFVRVLNEKTLLWPDYIGNNMFNTLGNIAINPRAGLLFMDFERGATLRITGEAHVIWDKAEIIPYPGAQRLVEFRSDAVIETTHAFPLRWSFMGYSPFNP